MYILIFEDGSICKTKEITNEDKSAVSDGLVDIIETSNPNRPLIYVGPHFEDIAEANP